MHSDRKDFLVGEFRVRPLLNRIQSADTDVTIKLKSMAVLECLAEAPGQVVSRNAIMDRVWPGATVTDDVLTQSIAELRRAFGDDARSARYIETVPRVGIRLVAETKAWSDEKPTEDGVPTARSTWRNLAVVTSVALLAITAIWLVDDRFTGPDIDANTIAVLPFDNLSGDPGQTYFSDGMSEEILNLLAQVPGLKVIARTSSFQYRDQSVDLREVGQDLGVATVLEGSVRTSGDTVRITAQLISTADGFHVWSETYDRTLDDVLKVQDDIAVAVVDELRGYLDLGPESVVATGRIRTSNEAYDFYMRGLQFMDSMFAPGQDEGNLEAPGKAHEYFRRATDIAPDFAPAWAWLAMALGWDTEINAKPYDEVDEVIRESIDRALDLGPELAETQFAAGWYWGWWNGDLTRGLEYYDRAIEINPNYAAAHAERSRILRELGRFHEYFDSAEAAIDLNPRDQWAHYDAMYARFHQGKLDNLEDDIRKERDLWPKSNALIDEAHLRYELGQFEHFPALHRHADALSPDFGLQPPQWINSAPRHFGETYLTLGLPDRARRFMAGRYEDVLDLYAGRYDEAIDHLEAEIEAGKVGRFGYHRWFRDIFASLAEAYLYSGRYEDLASIDRWNPEWAADPERANPALPQSELGNPPWPELAYAYALARTGKVDKAQKRLEAIAALLEDRLMQGVNVPNHYYELARLRALQGRTEEAFAAMERAIDMGWRRWYFDRDPILEPIRELPQFEALIARYDADIARMETAVMADFAGEPVSSVGTCTTGDVCEENDSNQNNNTGEIQ